MKLLSKAFLFSIVLALISFPIGSTSACSCIKLAPCESFGRASAVFIGRVIDGEARKEKRELEGKQVSTVHGIVKFDIEEVFKGVTTTQLEIGWDTSCINDGLILGEKYLIYAWEHSNLLFSSPCLRSTLVKSIDEDINFLKNLPALGTGGRLYGAVTAYFSGHDKPPLAGVTIVVTNEYQERIEAITDSKGNYEITGLKPGKYVVQPKWPQHYFNEYSTHEAIIDDRGCFNASFWAKSESRIAGRVIDSTGRPSLANLYLVSVDEQNLRFFARASKDGEFMIEGIKPGRYWLYVNLKDENEDAELFFYPGFSDRNRATMIDVGAGENLSGHLFQLPSQIKVHTVSGIVLYPDGKPAAKVRLLMFSDETNRGKYQTAYWLPQVETDAEGRFVLQGFKGNIYIIDARDDWNGKRKQLYSEPLKITLDKDIENLKLILSLTEPPENRRIPQKKVPEEKRQ